MTGHDHDDIRRELGVYILGSLPPSERSRVEHHLADCASCRDEVASLAALPPLLGRLTPTEADSRPPPFAALAERIGTEQRRTHRRERALLVIAAAAVLTAVAVVATPVLLQRPDPGLTFSDGSIAVATIDARSWGMAVRIEANDLPERHGYVAYAVATDGHRAQIASWEATGRPAVVLGACYLSPSEVQRVEIVAGGDAEDLVSVLRPG